MSRKRSTTPPETSKITRSTTVAYARKQKDGEAPAADPKADDKGAAAALDAETVIAPLAVPTSPPPMPPSIPAAEDVVRARAETVAMSPLNPVGAPPELPTHTPAAPTAVPASAVEDPTQMPAPRQIPAGNPEDAAPAPGRVPPGDSRSLRRGPEFALIYRQTTFVISRCGPVGKRGVWRVVEYPTSAAASHAYAKECSRFVSEGFSDYRD